MSYTLRFLSLNHYKGKIFLFFNILIMETSLFIGSILGPVMFAVWLGLLLNTEMYQKMIQNYSKESIALYTAALWWFVSWLLIIYSHNIWETSWIVVITLIGWLIFIKSALLLVLPTLFEKLVKKITFSNTATQIAGVFYGLFWIFLIFKTWM